MKWLERFGVSLIYLFLFLPMVVLVVLSFNSAKHGAAWEGFTLSWYTKLWSNAAILEALNTSVQIAIAASILSGVLGLAVGVTLAERKSIVLGKLSQLPIILPDVVIGLSLLVFFVWLNVPMGSISVVFAHATFGTAYVATLVRARKLALDPLLEDAARDLGATPVTTFLQVTLPQLRSALISGMLMTFTLSFDDFSIAFFTAGVGATTLPLKIYSMLKFGVTPEVNALSALILLMSLILVSASFWVRKVER